MSSSPLSKLSPPRLGRVFQRSRLFEQLALARESHSVIWIGAPAGAGKTTLAASYLAQQDIDPVWYSVDEGDADPASFFHFFALAAKRAGVRKLPLFTPEYQQALPIFTRNYFRDFYAGIATPAVVVFDNYQDAGTDTELDKILRYALEEIPPEIWVMIVSRSQPVAELARLATQDRVAELGWPDLQLDEAEHRGVVATLLGKEQVSEGQSHALFQMTQGWVTGLVLMLKQRGSALRETADLVDPEQLEHPELMFDYFSTHAMSSMAHDIREFLYMVALFPSMTAKLCEKLTGNGDAKSILRQLEKSYFFTTRRGIVSIIYEFHPLFRQYLLAQAAECFSSARMHALTVEAARLLSSGGDREHAVALLMQVEEWAALAEVIKEVAPTLVKQGRHSVLREWIEALPSEVGEQDNWVTYWHGVALLHEDPFDAYDLLCRSYREFSGKDDARGMYLAWVGIAEALFYRHDETQPGKYWINEFEKLRRRHPRYPSLEIRGKSTVLAFHNALVAYPDYPGFGDLLKKTERMFRVIPIKEIRGLIAGSLGWYYSIYADTDKLAALVADVGPLANSTAVPPFARLHAIAAQLSYYWLAGEKERALRTIERGLELANSSGAFFALHVLYNISVMVYASYGDDARAQQCVQDFQKLADLRQNVTYTHFHWLSGWVETSRHEFALAKSHLLKSHEVLQRLHIPWLELLTTGGLAQVCIELGEMELARSYLDRTHELAGLLVYPYVEHFLAHCLEAYWHDKMGDSATTRDCLEIAFGAAARCRWYADSFWERGMMTRLCCIALQHGIQPDYVKRLISIYGFAPPERDVPVEQWPYPVKVYTLGRFALRIDDNMLDLSGKSAARPLSLLKCLIALGGRSIAQEWVVEALWPELEGDAGLKAFHTTLYRLRKIVGYDIALVLKDGRLTLDSRFVWVDVWAAERVLDRLEELLKRDASLHEMEQWSKRLSNFGKGQFLAQDKDDAWALVCRERLKSRMMRVFTQLGQYWYAHAQFDLALACHEEVLRLDRLHEPAYQHQMRIYIEGGRHAEAAAAYERCKKELAAALGVMPSDQTHSIYSKIQRSSD